MKKQEPTKTTKSGIINIGLQRDLKEILSNPNNVEKIYKGVNKVTNFSIEIWFKEPRTFSSYVYYENEALMESDYKLLMEAIENGKNS